MMKKIVIKLGGSSLHNLKTLHELVQLVRAYRELNYQVVVVHGGGPAINEELTRRGIQWQFINGQRQTTPEMMAVIEEVLAGKINSMLVHVLQTAGIAAKGLSGAQEETLFCTQASAELMQVGKIEKVSTDLLEQILQLPLSPVPVLAPLGVGAGKELFNINADWAAAQIAMALGAEKLIFLTDQSGVLDQDRQLVPVATPSLIAQMIHEGVISGGMYTKVMTMMTALQSGVQQVRVLNANVASQLLHNENIGTLLVDTLPKAKKKAKKENLQWIQTVN